MTLDIRIPLGLLFTLIGCLLEGYGLMSGTAGPAVSLGGVDADQAWGPVLIVFGVGMLLLAYRHARVTRRGVDGCDSNTSGGSRSDEGGG